MLAMTEIILLHNTVRRTLIRLAPHIVCMFLIPLRYYILISETEEVSLLFKVDLDSISSPYIWSEYAITQLRVILSYVRMLVLPYNQNFDPDYHLYRTVLNPEIILSVLIWMAFMIAGVRLLRRQERTLFTDLTALSVFWFPVSLSISSSFIPLNNLMSEHRTYLASVAFISGAVAYIHHIAINAKYFQKYTFISGLCIVALIFGVLTVKRNQIYISRTSLWKDTVSKSPDKTRPLLSLGHAYLSIKRYDEAIKCYKKSFNLDPTSVNSYLSLGRIYKIMGQPMKAIEIYEQYLETNPPDAELLTDLSVSYAEQGMLNEAINSIQQVVDAKSQDARLLSFFAELNMRAGNSEVAERYYTEARLADKLDPTIDITDSLDNLEKLIGTTIVEAGN
jgi:tetratricopeptide (TPR) repeat protein